MSTTKITTSSHAINEQRSAKLDPEPIPYLMSDYFPEQKRVDQGNQKTSDSMPTNGGCKQKTHIQSVIPVMTKPNQHWGASFENKNEDNVRIYFQNINSLRLISKTECK